MDVLIIGCGVSGLTSGIRLLEAGRRVAIVARDLPPHTTSNVAAAVWEPFEAYPAERVAAWGAVAYREFLALAGEPSVGVLVADVLESQLTPTPHPVWASSVEGFRDAEPSELPAGAVAGVAYRAPVIDTSRYLTYLLNRFLALGGSVEQRALANFDEAFALSAAIFASDDASADARQIVVNCSGLGSRELAHDGEIAPARGQVVRIEQSDYHTVLVQNTMDGLAYIVPRIDDIVLGGTFDVGAEDLTVNPATRRAIIIRCAELALSADRRFAMSLAALVGGDYAHDFAARVAPEHADTPPAVIREEAVGLRPIRPQVRVETETVASARFVVHNYGHGGAGITLSWGCAAEVADLVSACAAAPLTS